MIIFLIITLAGAIFAQRVVSLAPAITEIIFALDKGPTLVGVTTFCDYPPTVKKISKVGGLLDVNVEAILALTPDIIITYPEQFDKVKLLQSQTIVLAVKHQGLSDLFRSMLEIGRILHAESKAKSLVRTMQKKLQDVRRRTKGGGRARTLIVAGRNADELKNMYIIGKKDFLNELLEIAGGTNAYQGTISYPSISLETVIYLNPDFILEISAHYEGIADEKVYELWKPFTMIEAVARRQIKIIKKTFWLRPGPRVASIAEELAGLFSAHPKVNKTLRTNNL